MSEFEDSICIAYPSVWPDTIDEPHSTLIWLGNISEASFTKGDVLEVLDSVNLPAPGPTPVAGLEMFGPDKDIPVALLSFTPSLRINHSKLSLALSKKEIYSASEFDYTPHVSISYDPDFPSENIELPELVELSAPVLWWGDER